jgi:phage terminase small subunit
MVKNIPKRLDAREQRFVEEYLIDLDTERAALAAGYSASVAKSKAYQWVSNGKVKAHVYDAVRAGQKARGDQLEVDSKWVLKRWIEIATADPNELIEYRRGPCPECWGGADLGGDGRAEPTCPKCHGEGHGKVFVHDSRKLKGPARRLYAGVQLGKDGLKVLMRDQDAALVNIAKHLGMFKERIEHSGTISLAGLIEGSFKAEEK